MLPLTNALHNFEKTFKYDKHTAIDIELYEHIDAMSCTQLILKLFRYFGTNLAETRIWPNSNQHQHNPYISVSIEKLKF